MCIRMCLWITFQHVRSALHDMTCCHQFSMTHKFCNTLGKPRTRFFAFRSCVICRIRHCDPSRPIIDNLEKSCERTVQHGETPYHGSQNIRSCVEKLRMFGKKVLGRLAFCWNLYQVFVFSSHHTTNIINICGCLLGPWSQKAYSPNLYPEFYPSYHSNHPGHMQHVNSYGVCDFVVRQHQFNLSIFARTSLQNQLFIPNSFHQMTLPAVCGCCACQEDAFIHETNIFFFTRKHFDISNQLYNKLHWLKQHVSRGFLLFSIIPQNMQWIKHERIEQHMDSQRRTSIFHPTPKQSTNSRRLLYTSFNTTTKWVIHMQGFVQYNNLQIVQALAGHGSLVPHILVEFSPTTCGTCDANTRLVCGHRLPYFDRFQRIGEATNPGPSQNRTKTEHLNIYHCNPTSLVGKENHFDHMLNGIHLISETSATQTAQKICTARFKHKNMKCLWSYPTNAYKQSAANLRGHAGGTAIVSPFPMHRGLEPIPSYLQRADRFVDGVVQYYPHLYMYCAAIYGPHINHRYYNPRTIMNDIMNHVAQKGLRFQGPVCVAGDFNCSLQDIECWPALKAAGWVDAAEFSAHVNCHPIETTSNDNARHSFILCNRQLAAALIDCRTIKHHLFSVHPVLHARFNYKAATQSFLQWKLPKSFDRYIIDTQTAENYATKECLDKHATHEMALQNNDLHALSKSWTHIAEQTLAHSAIDVEGKAVKVRPGHLGRAKESHFTTQPAAMPIIPRPRDGDHQPISEQGSVELRRWGKQLHRLQSLVRQYNSYNQTHNILAFGQLQTLWISILNAKGFDNKFQQWILDHHEMFVPLQLPQIEYCIELKNTFAQWYTTQEHTIWLQRTKLKQLEVIVDIPNGGKLAFQQLRDEAYPPIHAIHFQREATMIRTRCTKDGSNVIKIQAGHNLCVGPLHLQDQHVNITQVLPNQVKLDKKLNIDPPTLPFIKRTLQWILLACTNIYSRLGRSIFVVMTQRKTIKHGKNLFVSLKQSRISL